MVAKKAGGFGGRWEGHCAVACTRLACLVVDDGVVDVDGLVVSQPTTTILYGH